MFPPCEKIKSDILSFKKPNIIDKVAETIPKPKGAIPNFGLPKWKVMPLESKIPMVPGPEGAYNFTRQKLGKRLWLNLPNEFDLNDPYCHEIKMPYDSLHDKHLVPFFSKKNNIQFLLRAGLVTKDLDVKCSLRDYNIYRMYLRRFYCDKISREFKRRAHIFKEEFAKNPPFQSQRDQKRQKKLELIESRKRNREKVDSEKEAKMQQWKNAEERDNQRLEASKLAKEEHRQFLLANREARYQHIRQKLKNAVFMERQRIISTLMNWRKKERKRKKERRLRIAHENEEKRKAIEEKWKLQHENQRKQIEKEKYILECINSRKEKFITKYNEKIKKEEMRMQKLLARMKMFTKCYLARHLSCGRVRVCCKMQVEDTKDEKKEGKIIKRRAKDKTESLRSQDHKDGLRLGVKKRKTKRKKTAKKKLKQSEPSVKSESVELQSGMAETESKPEPSKVTEPEVKEKCRCEIIKASREAALTQKKK